MSLFRPHIESMAGYQPGEQPREGEFVKLNTNENPYPPSPRVIEAIRQAANDGLRRYPDPLASEFRAQAARLLGLEPDWILAGNGSDDVLTIATRCFAGPDDRIAAPTPSYVLYRSLAAIQGARYEEVAFGPGWELPEQLGHGAARLVFVPNPNSPSGTSVPRGALAKLAGALAGRGVLVVDEAYVDFADAHCVDLVREFDNTIVTRSLSKSYGLAGIRFGYAVARPEIIAGMIKVKDSYNCDSLSIAAASAALADQPYMQQCTQRVRATRTRLTAELRKLGFHVPDSQANFVWCTRGPAPAQSLYLGLKSRRILVRYMTYPGFGDGLRISVGTDAEIDQLLSELEQLVKVPNVPV